MTVKIQLASDAGAPARDRLTRAAGALGVSLPTAPAPVTGPGVTPAQAALSMIQSYVPRALRAGDIDLGLADNGDVVGIDLDKLIDGRLLVQGVPGAGKSWTLRRLLEQCAGRVQQIVIDPEGEFESLAEELGWLYVEGWKLRPGQAATLASRARQHRTSLVLDLSDMSLDDKMLAAAAFFTALVEAPREWWSAVLVAVDEAQLFAPFGGQGGESTAARKEVIAATADLVTRGRKRGLISVLATTRVARLSKSVTGPIVNFLIGLNAQDLDIKRAAGIIGWDANKAFDRLPILVPGQFVAAGQAFSHSALTVTVGPVRSKHVGAAPEISPPPALSRDQAAEALGIDELVEDKTPTADDPAAFIKDPRAPLAGRVLSSLVAGGGTTVSVLAASLSASATDVGRAIDLLRERGAVAIEGTTVSLGAPEAIAALVGAVVAARLTNDATGGLHAAAYRRNGERPKRTWNTAGKRGWSADEDRIVTEGYRAGEALVAIMDKLEASGFRRRTSGAVSMRAHGLGLVSEKAARGWTEPEDDIIRRGYEGEVRIADVVANLQAAGFDRGRVSVQMRAIALGITRDRVKYWTEPEKAIAIAGLESGKPYREIVAELKVAGFERGMTSILKFAQKNNFNRAGDPWTAEQIATLKEKYAATPIRDLETLLGKPQGSIRTRASQLGLRKRAEWTDAERQILINGCAAGETLIETVKKLPGREYAAVWRIGRTMGLDFRKTKDGDAPAVQTGDTHA